MKIIKTLTIEESYIEWGLGEDGNLYYRHMGYASNIPGIWIIYDHGVSWGISFKEMTLIVNEFKNLMAFL